MQRTFTAAVLIATIAALAGCGQMGPLYMPPPENTTGAQSGQSTEPTQQPAAAS